jgi:hypothetical protein
VHAGVLVRMEGRLRCICVYGDRVEATMHWEPNRPARTFVLPHAKEKMRVFGNRSRSLLCPFGDCTASLCPGYPVRSTYPSPVTSHLLHGSKVCHVCRGFSWCLGGGRLMLDAGYRILVKQLLCICWLLWYASPSFRNVNCLRAKH